VSRFPAAFRPPAFASWVILRPLRDWAFLTVGLPGPYVQGLDLIGVVTFHTSQMRPGWVPPLLRGGDALPTGKESPGRRLPPPSGQPCSPLPQPISEGARSRSIIRGSLTFTRPVFPLPVAPGWNAGPWASTPELHTKPSPATHVRVGTGLEHWPGTIPTASADLHRYVHCTRATSCHTSFFLASTLITGCPAAMRAVAASLM
jgi:hypothetical protein